MMGYHEDMARLVIADRHETLRREVRQEHLAQLARPWHPRAAAQGCHGMASRPPP